MSNLFLQDTCSACGKVENAIFNFRMKKCHMCYKTFCKTCLVTAYEELPEFLMVPTSQREPKVSTETGYFLCKSTCHPIAVSYWISEKKNSYLQELAERIQIFLNSTPEECTNLSFYQKPSSVEDGLKRKLYRGIALVEQVSNITGFGAAFGIAKSLYYGKEVFQNLLSTGLIDALVPVVEKLQTYGISGPTPSYYFGCMQIMSVKQATGPVFSYGDGEDGVLMSECPSELLEYAGSFVNVGEWLYRSRLPKPHDTDDWSAWYLSRMLHRKGYTVLACQNSSTELPDGTRCPGYALIGKKYETPELIDESLGSERLSNLFHGECILVIRGSKTFMDWSINLDDKMDPYRYFTDSNLENAVRGYVHRGIYQGIKSILDTYGIRTHITDLFEKGYKVRILGHSLGAGASVLLAAELQHGLRLSNNPDILEMINMNASIENMHKKRLHAIGFATPAVVSEDIAEAINKDGLALSIMHEFDVVPRLSQENVYQLSQKIIKFTAVANEWREQDLKALKEYTLLYGRSGDMTGNNSVSSTVSAAAASIDTGVTDNKPTVAEASNTFTTTSATVTTDTSIQVSAAAVPLSPNAIPVPSSSITVSASVAKSVNSATVVVSAAAAPVPATATAVVSGNSNTATSSAPIVVTAVPVAAAPADPEPSNMKIDPTSPKTFVDSESGATISFAECRIRLVPPGLIIQLHETEDLCIKASLIDYRHNSLKKILLLFDRILDAHRIETCFAQLRMLRLQNPNWNEIKINISLNKPRPSLEMKDAEMCRKNYYSNSNSSSSSSASAAASTSEISVVDQNNIIPPCGVCGSNCEWAYILRSPAAKGMFSQKCSVCSMSVCVMCSPFGDTIPGDGVNNWVTLDNLGIIIPSRGWLVPRRICMHCYLDSYDLL